MTTPETPPATDIIRAPVLYVTDLSYERPDPADLFDLAFLLRSQSHTLSRIVTQRGSDAERVLDALTVRAGREDVPYHTGTDGLRDALQQAAAPVNVVVVGGFTMVAALLDSDRALVREKVARLFLIGGHANDYAAPNRAGERVPFDPRLRERNRERFAPTGDARLGSEPSEQAAFARLLTSGEGVIWLPRDISLWRYAAPQVLQASGDSLLEFLLHELGDANRALLPDRYDAWDAPALLSALPAFLLAVRPDPTLWMRLFRAVTARVETDPVTGLVSAIATRTDTPNLYAVIATDGEALGKMLTATLKTAR